MKKCAVPLCTCQISEGKEFAATNGATACRLASATALTRIAEAIEYQRFSSQPVPYQL